MMNGVEKITGKIIADAEKDAKERLDKAKAECDATDADYAARAEALRDKMLSDAESDAENIVARVKSTAAVEKRNIALGVRGELLDAAFNAAMSEVRAMPEEKYRELLTNLVASSVIKQINAEETERRDYGDSELETADAFEVEFYRNERDKHGKAVVDAAKSAVTAKLGAGKCPKIVLSDKTFDSEGGVIIRYGDIEINCTLPMLFARLREECEGDVYRILFN